MKFKFIPLIAVSMSLTACGFIKFPSIPWNPFSVDESSETTSTTSEGGSSSTSSGDKSSSSTGTSSGGKTSSSSSKTSSSSNSSSSSKTSSSSKDTSSETGEVTKKKLSYSYNDYIKNNVYDLSNCPTLGEANVLIIPIWFTDSTTYISTSKKASVRSDIEKAYLGTNEETGWRSVKTYYEELSQGKLTLNGVVAPWYACGQSSSDFYTDSSATSSLVATATSNYFSTSGAKRTDFDKDKDGYLDAVLLIYGAPDYAAAKTANDNMWAYCYWLQQTSYKNVSNPGPNVFFWASYDFMYSSGSKATAATGASNYGGGDQSYCNIDTHTYIHEMGHVLGLEDYYDYSQQYTPAGSFSMQDYNVGSHDPYSAMAYGYVDPYVPTSTATIELKPFQGNNEVILLSTHNSSVNSPFDEYLLLELYTPTGLNKFDVDYHYHGNYPQGPNTVGIRLWHVDARLTTYTGSSWSTSLITNPTAGYVSHAMSNTYYKSAVKDYCSVLGSGYYDYNILQLIRNNKSATYQPTDDLSSSSLFKAGDTFSMSTYGSQFVKTGKMNSNTTLGWTFKVNNCSSTGASITVTKA